MADVRALSRDTEIVYVEGLADDMAEALGQLPKLRAIVQNGSPTITDAGVAHLSLLSTLEWLDLEWSTQITDAALERIAGLPNLKYLDICFCGNLTSEGIHALKMARQKLEIEK